PDRPEKIDGRGPSLTYCIADFVELAFEFARSLSFGIIDAERDSHGGRDSNGGSPAHHHVADHVRNLLVGGAVYVNFLRRQLRLIDEAHATVSPFKSLDHKN